MLVQPLTEVLQESFEREGLQPSFKQGIIKILYKKGDPREIRNYRPLTMLNTDYKILTKLLANRIMTVLDSIISPQQLGFVPGRRITEASHLVKLVQAYLDETDEDGLLIALDFEKAFDSVSWEYLHASLEALGFGPNIRKWYGLLYNEYEPPERIVQANGIRSDSFHLLSSVPQGCPLSPITFLFITEALTRLISDDDQYKGIKIGEHIIKLSQFADDTLLMLRGYSSLRRAWRIIDTYTKATGMSINVKKTEGIRCGALKRKPVPHIPELSTDKIKWVKKGEWVRLLGIPFWEDYDPNLFWDQLYNKTKCKLAAWRNHALLTQVGRNMIANSLILSRFRYWVQCMSIPDYINEAIVEDTQALIWAKEADFDAEEMGTRTAFRRWMKKGVQYRPRKELGLGVLDWPSHVKGLRTIWLFRYLDATCGEYKLILDQWFRRYHEGRGSILTTIPTKDLTKSLTYRPSALPQFWKQALQNLRELEVVRLIPNVCISIPEALSMPLWTNPLFQVCCRQFVESWRYDFETNTVKDTFNVSLGIEYSEDVIRSEIRSRFQVTSDDRIKLSRGKFITLAQMLRQWKAILRVIPTYITDAARSAELHSELHSYSNVARNMLTAHGWAPGRGLGRNLQGRSEPVFAPTQLPLKAGLGSRVRSNRKDKVKESRSQFKATLLSGQEVYGKYDAITATLYAFRLSTKGCPIPTGESIHIHSSNIRDALWWGEGIVGIAESTFPHPEGWTVQGTDCPIDKLSVKRLTAAFRLTAPFTEPTCKATWTRKLGEIKWELIGLKYNLKILSPRDFMSHCKNILHRALLTRHINKDAPSFLCRLCRRKEENITHLARCSTLAKVWDKYLSLAKYDGLSPVERDRLILLGIPPSGGPLPPALSDLHLITWKFIIIHFTLVDLKRQKFIPDEVWKGALRRYLSKLNSAVFKAKLRLDRCAAREETFSCNSLNAALKPLASIDSAAQLSLDRDLDTLLTRLSIRTSEQT